MYFGLVQSDVLWKKEEVAETEKDDEEQKWEVIGNWKIPMIKSSKACETVWGPNFGPCRNMNKVV